MTFGKKLSNYRKVAGLTQQQLADHLNVSAQAVSKWENDLSEPDLATMRELSKLYNISIDKLLDISEENSSHVINTAEVANSVSENLMMPIGFCIKCGITVSQETRSDVPDIVVCKKCAEKQKRAEEQKKLIAVLEKQKKKKEEEEERAREAKRREEERERAKKKIEEEKKASKRAVERNIDRMLSHRNKSLMWAGISAIPFLIIAIVYIFQADSAADATGGFFMLLSLDICIASFVGIMFYDTYLKDFLLYMCTASINWPGLIFEFSIDGFIWLIGMKLLFAVLGFIIGALAAIIGIIISLLLAPFTYAWRLLSISILKARGKYDLSFE